MTMKLISVFVGVLLLASCAKNDSDLQRAASDKLSADNINGVAVAVKDGTATLTGEVKDMTTRTKAEADVKTIQGIKTVNNHLSLIPITAVPTPSGQDKAMEDAITANLKKANVSSVTVSVDNGQVTLGGQVTSNEDLAKATLAASSIHPKGITNNISVKK